MYLLDTNVVSEMRKAFNPKQRGAKIDPRMKAWIESVPWSRLYLSVIVIFELEIGFQLLERHDPFQAAILRSWVRDNVIPEFDGRILPVDLAVAQQCAKLHVPNPAPHRDAFIAATALVHGMAVVTRNVRDFEPTGVKILNPWQD
jgi:predicted nucleic acid-binding protein